MKIFTLLFISALSIIPSLSHANEDQLRRQVLGKFALTSGGWHVNEKCKVITGDKRIELEWYVENITKKLGTMENPALLGMIQKNAQSVSQKSDSADCKQKSTQIVQGAFEASKNLNTLLQNDPYKKGIYIQHKYADIALGMAVENKCQFLSNDIKDDVQQTYQKVKSSLSTKISKVQEQEQNKKVQKKLEVIDCKNKKNHLLTTIALGGIRRLEVLLELR